MTREADRLHTLSVEAAFLSGHFDNVARVLIHDAIMCKRFDYPASDRSRLGEEATTLSNDIAALSNRIKDLAHKVSSLGESGESKGSIAV